MKFSALFLYTFLSFFGITQNQSYFINSSHGSSLNDLLLVEYANNTQTTKQAFSFRDSIESKNMEGIKNVPLFFSPFQNNKVDSMPSKISNFHFGPISENKIDSINVNGKWYTIKTHYDDDRFVGGRQNYVNRQIWISEFGMIYSFSNYSHSEELLMLCHKDSSKQVVLDSIYKHLENTNLWFNWNKLSKLSAQYPFSTCAEKLQKEWNEAGSALKLVYSNSTTVNNIIIYNVTIKNISNTGYTLPNYYSISPASATLHNQDSTSNNWDLMDTHYGKHFKRVNTQLFLSPGEEVSFTQNLSLRSGTGHILSYQGFQIFSQRTFTNGLFSEDIIYNDENYKTYTHRQIF